MRLSPFAALLVSCLSWFAIGIFLLCKGVTLLVELAQPGRSSAIIDSFRSMAGGREQAVLVFICIGLLVGFMKGRYVLSRTVNRISTRIFSFAGPIELSQLYPLSYLILIASMVVLGLSLKWLPVPQEIRGTVDVAIGSALTNGALLYLRLAFTKGRQVAK